MIYNHLKEKPLQRFPFGLPAPSFLLPHVPSIPNPPAKKSRLVYKSLLIREAIFKVHLCRIFIFFFNLKCHFTYLHSHREGSAQQLCANGFDTHGCQLKARSTRLAAGGETPFLQEFTPQSKPPFTTCDDAHELL